MHEYRTFSGVLASYFANKFNVPLILQPRGTIPRYSNYAWKILFDKILGYPIINNACKVIASSHVESDQYGKIFPYLSKDKVIHIPNGINFDDYSDLPQKGQFKNKYGIDQGNKIVLFLSRIHSRKGADLLLSAFARLLKCNMDTKLVIAGPDEGYLNKLMKNAETLHISENVIFPGPLYGKEKLKAFVDAYVLVLPSKDRSESFGNVVIEALACGTPVIITNNCGVSEYIGQDSGFVIDYDINQMYHALYEIISNEKMHDSMCEEAKKSINNYDIDQVIKQYEKVYETCQKRQ